MRVYIAGPMTGLPDNNRAAFAFAWNRLMEAGFDAVSPHFMESAIEIETRARMGTAAVYRHVLPVDLFALSSVDAVLALPGWDGSRGALFEKHFADLIEIPWVTAGHEGVTLAAKMYGVSDVPTMMPYYVGECIAKLTTKRQEDQCHAP